MSTQPPEIPGYNIKRTLNQTAMSVVYLAEQLPLGRPVVVKVIAPEIAAIPGFKQRFLREARILGELNHPNIVTIYDMGEIDEQLYLSMEYVPGGELTQRIRTGLSAAEALEICQQVASALGYAHSHGYVHRDIKPANILFTDEGRAMVTDFGIARVLESEETQLTRVGTSIGTPLYMAPEQFDSGDIDQRADLYSLGVVLFMMLSGEPPYSGKNTSALMFKHQSADIPDLPATRQQYQKLLDRFLQKDPNDRFQNADEVISALNDYLLPAEDTVIREATVEDKTTGKPANWVTKTRLEASSTRMSDWSVALTMVASIALLLILILSQGQSLGDRPVDETASKSTSTVSPAAASKHTEEVSVAVARFVADEPSRFTADAVGSELFNQLDRFSNLKLTPLDVSWSYGVNAAGTSTFNHVNFHIGGRVEDEGPRQLTLNVFDRNGSPVGSRTFRINDSVQTLTDTAAIWLARTLNSQEDSVTWTPEMGSSADVNPSAFEDYTKARLLLETDRNTDSHIKARKLAEQAIAIEPRYAEAYAVACRAAIVEYELGRTADALTLAERHCNRALTLSPGSAEVFLALGDLYYQMGEFEQARQSLTRSLKTNGQQADARIRLADVYLAEGEQVAAEAAYDQVVKEFPAYDTALNARGIYYFQTGAIGKARQDFKRITELTPNNSYAYNNLGLAHYLGGNFQAAIESWRKAEYLELEPNPGTLTNLATANYFLGDYKTAIEINLRAVELQPDDYLLWANLGDAQREAGESAAATTSYTRAVKMLEESLQHNPEDPMMQARKAYLSAYLGDREAVSIASGKIDRENLFNPYVAYDLAMASNVINRKAETMYWLEKAISLGFPVVLVSADPAWKTLKSSEPFLRLISAAE